MKAQHTPGLSDMNDDGERGQFEIVTEPTGQKRLWFICPGCGRHTAIALRPVVDGSPQSWEFDGNEQAPTLKPSIKHVGCWHGWLTAGVFA